MLRNKRILITAGPTWVPIDSVRVISNIASGETGFLLAEKLSRLGAKVTLLTGSQSTCCLDKKIKLVKFSFFNELLGLALKELRSQKFDIVVHSAAVSDYRPVKAYPGKISSGMKRVKLELVPTVKILDLFKRIDKSLIVIAFKFQAKAAKKKLLSEALKLLRRQTADAVVANTFFGRRYHAYLVDKARAKGPLTSKDKLTDALIAKIGDLYG